MDDNLWSLLGSLDLELLQIKSLIKGAVCIREHQEDANAETDLLSLAAEILDESRKTLEEIQQEQRKLEKKKKKEPAASATQPEREA